jgi:glycosyltransferase involved in cell wall biosynthesis
MQFVENQANAVVTVSATTFQRAFLSGFEGRSDCPEIINVPDIGSWPKRCKKVYIPGSHAIFHGMSCENVGFYNITYLKQKFIYASLRKALRGWMKKHRDEEVVILVYSLIFPYLKAAIDIKKEFQNVKVSCIVLDLPEYFGDNNSLLYRLLGDGTEKTYQIAKDIDSYVLLTEYMKEPLNVGEKPWMLMEGIYEPREFQDVKKQAKTILYTGKLDARFGIHELVDNFSKLKDPDYRLWICGNGLDREYVENKAREDSRIIYYGQVKQERVFEMQREASLLINPRKPEGEYTKYSFPSKTMEYMASGTPTLMYRLPGMPEEYEPYVALFKDSSDEEMTRVMEEWLNKPKEELDAFGVKAREFIMNNKTADKQIDRFMNFIKDIYGE